ncbi:E3 ubiquitin-protein ligase rad18 [Saitoella coloradoensis]
MTETDITDPSDWSPTLLPALSSLDSSLRCQICKDFFTAPLITTCSHTFCSLCIRRCLATEQICPTCRSPEQEMRLRRNVVVAEIVEVWAKERQALLDLARKDRIPHSTTTTTTTTIPRPPTPNDIYDLSSSPPPPSRRQPRRAAAASPQPDPSLVPCPVCSRPKKEAEMNAHLDRCLSGRSSPPPPPSHRRRRSSPAPHPPQLQPTTPEGRTTRNRTTVNGNGNGIGNPNNNNNNNNTTTRAITNPPPDMKRLPKLNYALHTESKLRHHLSTLSLPTQGPKPLLQRRHAEWVSLWNANLDALHPKPKRELLRELGEWERTVAGASAAGEGIAGSGRGGGKGRREVDLEGWGRRHEDEFRDLIVKAREAGKKRKREEEEGNDAETKAVEDEGGGKKVVKIADASAEDTNVDDDDDVESIVESIVDSVVGDSCNDDVDEHSEGEDIVDPARGQRDSRTRGCHDDQVSPVQQGCI